MIFQKFFIKIYVLFISAAFLSCGIDENYYLPQIPEGNIITALNTEAVVYLPPISDDKYYYAGSYTIFYRIYISNFLTESSTELSQISPSLASDYNFFSQITNPTNTSAITSSNTFRNRNYYEIEFEGTDIASILPKSGGTLRISFPTFLGDYPTASIDEGQEYRLSRSGQLISPEPRNDLYFRNTLELRIYENANANINADVAGRIGEMQYAYVSMYIAAVGTNPDNFMPIYSKPTHISVFRLTDAN
jgi:hypothetical protein